MSSSPIHTTSTAACTLCTPHRHPNTLYSHLLTMCRATQYTSVHTQSDTGQHQPAALSTFLYLLRSHASSHTREFYTQWWELAAPTVLARSAVHSVAMTVVDGRYPERKWRSAVQSEWRLIPRSIRAQSRDVKGTVK